MQILCIDEEPLSFAYLDIILPPGFNLVPVKSADEFCATLFEQSFDLVLIDIEFDQGRGLDLIPIIIRQQGEIPVIVHTRSTQVHDVVASMKLGAFHYLNKLVKRSELLSLLMQCKAIHEQSQVEFCSEFTNEIDFIIAGCVGKYTTDQLLRSLQAGQLFLNGECGTGKSMLARHLYEKFKATAKLGMLKKTNFANYSGADRCSEMQWIDLFGSNEASSGKKNGKPGLLEQNDAGIVYLEEVSNLKHDVQAALVHFIEYRSINRYRGSFPVATNCRLILASKQIPDTNGRIPGIVPQLHDRIWHQRIELKPLRSRTNDMIALAWHYLNCAQRTFPTNRGLNFHPTVLDKLTKYTWPGNIVELKSQIFSAVRNCKGKVIKLSDLT